MNVCVSGTHPTRVLLELAPSGILYTYKPTNYFSRSVEAYVFIFHVSSQSLRFRGVSEGGCVRAASCNLFFLGGRKEGDEIE